MALPAYPTHRGESGRAPAWLTRCYQSTSLESTARLCGRFARLNNRGVQRNKICVAVARELAGFVWAIAHMAMEPHNTPKQPS